MRLLVTLLLALWAIPLSAPPSLSYEWLSHGRVQIRWTADVYSCVEVESPLLDFQDTILTCGTEGGLVTDRLEAGDWVSLRNTEDNSRISIQIGTPPPNAGLLRVEWIGPATTVFYFTGPGTLSGPEGEIAIGCTCAVRQLAPFPGLGVPLPGQTWLVVHEDGARESVVVPIRYFQSVLPWVSG